MEARFVLPRAAILFCGFPVCPWADQSDGEGQTGKLAYMDEHTHRAARGVSPGERNKLFDLFFPSDRTLSVSSVKSVVKRRTACTLVPGGHYYE